MVSNEIQKFNKLKRTRMAPSGLVPNIWHFDVRYIHLEPVPGHVLFLFQPDSKYVHMEHLPLHRTDPYKYFPETADEAAPELVRAIVHAFNSGFALKGIETSKQEARAPWALKTEEKNLAVAVGKEMKRVGVIPALCSIEVSSKNVVDAALGSFLELFAHLAGAPPTTPLQFPHSIFFNYDPNANLPPEVAEREQGQDSEMELVLQYIRLIDNCSPMTKEKVDARVPGVHGIFSESQTMLRKPFAEVLQTAEAGDPMMFVDCAARSYLGLGCTRDRQTARNYLVEAAFHPKATEATRATAHAMLTRWYHDMSGPGGSMRMRYLYASLHHACLAVTYAKPISPLGFSIPQILLAFTKMQDLILKDNPQVKTQYPALFAALKEAKDRCDRDTQASYERMKQPLRYRCAVLGCGIEADHGRMLKRCAGSCDDDKKPHYCSKECQKKDWPNHKGFCKPGMPCSVIDAEKALKSAPFGGKSKQGQRSVLVNTGGGEMSFSSSTMSAQDLKEMREAVERMGMEDGDKDGFRRMAEHMRNLGVEIVQTKI